MGQSISKAKVFFDIRAATSNIEEYRRLVSSLDCLWQLIDEYPQYADDLIQPILNESTERERLIPSMSALKAFFTRVNNNVTQQLLNSILGDIRACRRYIKAMDDIKWFITASPQGLAIEYIHVALGDIVTFRQLINTLGDLDEIRWVYNQHNTEHIDFLFSELIIQEPEEFRRLVLSIPDLRKIVSNGVSASLIWPVLDNIEDLRRLILDFNGLMQLIRVFSSYQEDIIVQVITDDELCQRIVNTKEIFWFIANKLTHSEQKNRLLQPILTDMAKWRRLVTSIDDVINLVRKFPEHKQALAERLLLDMAERNLASEDIDDYYLLMQILPNHREQLLCKLLIRFSNGLKSDKERYYGFVRFVKNNPYCKSAATRLLLTDTHVRRSFITSLASLKLFHGFLPDDSEKLFMGILSDTELFQTIVTNTDELREFILLSDYVDETVMILTNDLRVFRALIPSFSRLIQIIRTMEEYVDIEASIEALLQPLLLNEEIWLEMVCTIYDFCQVVRKAPQQKKAFLDKLFADNNAPQRLIDTQFALDTFLERFPEHKDTIIQLILSDIKWLRRLIEPHEFYQKYYQRLSSADHFIWFVKTFPPHSEVLLDILLNNPVLFEVCWLYTEDGKSLSLYQGINTYFLKYLVEKFPHHEERLISFIISNKIILDCIFNDCFTTIASLSPRFTEALFQILFSDGRSYQATIASGYALARVAEDFPQHTERLLQRLLNEPGEYERLVRCSESFTRIFLQFPDHKREILDPLFKNPRMAEFRKMFEKEITNDSSSYWKGFWDIAKLFFGIEISVELEIIRQNVISHHHLNWLIFFFPEHRDAILSSVIADSAELNTLFPGYQNLRETIIFFDLLSIIEVDILIGRIMGDVEIVGRLFKSIDDIESFFGRRDKYDDPLKLSGQNKVKLVTSIVYEPRLFLELFHSLQDLQNLLTILEWDNDDSKKLLAVPILSNIAAFDRFIKNKDELELARKMFSGHSEMFEQETIEDARLLVQKKAAHMELLRTSRLLAQGARSKNSLFSHLPDEILINIVCRVHDIETHSFDDTFQIVGPGFDRPS